ncbi:MAG: hypothetical protein F4110_03095 [Acidimicrobiaceae bacterium]|nr:hypothetical protein [Acidimicrobiaceae bacterium]MXZ98083.1 hypothetical protein [Acidimicrobiaceae bacterium]MYE76622.1 hypothetical protein [Acidimicrobiaceae bacterium]MYE95787.1 hypothetical protein [Acidimicrobiaceae bacterium]MYH42404.1 hypothetical protein [Acidimicrobiaceae bacterium]
MNREENDMPANETAAPARRRPARRAPHEENGVPGNESPDPPSSRWSAGRADAVSAVAGVLFVAIAALALADLLWTEIDPVLVAGGAVIAVGAAMIAGVFRRGRGGGQSGS